MASTLPIELNLHRQSRVLEIKYDQNKSFNLPCEYLRVFSPSAEVQGHGPGQRVLQVGKENVNIEKIEVIGNYAVCLHFDDGHNSGIYSWEYLHQLSHHHERNWQEYLHELHQAGYTRKERLN